LSHVLRRDVLLQVLIEGRMTSNCSKWRRGRKRLQMMNNIGDGTRYELLQ